MKEDLLHFIWKYKKLQLADLITTKNESVIIIDTGVHNHLSGPDFFNAKINIDGQLWAGNVEIHLNASDWYAHHHEKDPNYNNVILHVVWEDDAEIFRTDSSIIPTLELKNYISKDLLGAYQKLLHQKGTTFINCEKDILTVDDFLFENWLDRLYFERLERKSNFVFELLEESKNNWEQVLFAMLLKNFGLKINGPAFLSLAQALDFSAVRKLQNDRVQLESVLFGMSHLLNDETILDEYYVHLKKEFRYLKSKLDLKEESVQKPEFFKLRPPNFPTIRLSQMAGLYSKHQNLFSKLIHASKLEQLYEIFDVNANAYWNTHFTFGKSSKKSIKRLTRKFVDLLTINTILPLKFCYATHLGKDVNGQIFEIISQIAAEGNSVVSNFRSLKIPVKNAMESQALLQLYNAYCTKNRCLQCVVGNSLLNRNS